MSISGEVAIEYQGLVDLVVYEEGPSTSGMQRMPQDIPMDSPRDSPRNSSLDLNPDIRQEVPQTVHQLKDSKYKKVTVKTS